jgi:putative FmdB family regulatory protein
MPTYEFRCSKGHEFERFYKTMSTAPSEALCPECGAVAVRQLSGGGGLVFKGSGFYLTDYGKNAHRKPAPEQKEGIGKAEGKADSGKAEAKAEGGRAEGGKAEGGRAEGGRAEGGRTESPTHNSDAKSGTSGGSSPNPKAPTPKPKSE